MSELALEMAGLTYRYPNADRDALADVDLDLAPGEFCVLAGRSGSGKTTLMRAACGLVPHFHGGEIAGRLDLGGLDVRDHGPGELAARVAYVAQEPETQVVSTTVRAEIELPLELRGETPPARARAIEEVALALAIPHLLDRATDSLSGGELQRVALAAALATRPQLLLLDEPTSQLDPVSGDELIWLLRRLNEEWGVTVLLSEHRLERCLAAADRVIAMDAGRIAFDGSPTSFLEWAMQHDSPLATPVARLFHLCGIHPLPTGVRQAREVIAATRDGAGAGAGPGSTSPSPRAGSAPQRIAPTIPDPAPLPAQSPALDVRGAWVTLPASGGPREVLRDVDLRVEPCERIALMGRNGAGKSTLLRAVAGLVEPTRGHIQTPGDVALLPQQPADLFLHERVDEELPGEDGRCALAATGLEGLGDADPRDLSGGERQRLALAIVMAGRADESDSTPGLILLDEPTRGMDRARKRELAGLAGELSGRGAAVIIATHDVEYAATFADRVVLLGDGELIADGPCEELLSGGWYFSTEVARVLRVPGVISPEAGARVISGDPVDEAVRIGAGEGP